MNCKIWKLILCVVIGGVIIEDMLLFSYYFIFPRFEVDYLIGINVILGTLIAVIAICARNKSLWYSLLCWLILIISCFLISLFNAYTGFAKYLLSTFDGEIGVGTQNVIGLQYLLSEIAIFGNVVIIIILRDIFIRICKVIKRKYN